MPSDSVGHPGSGSGRADGGRAPRTYLDSTHVDVDPEVAVLRRARERHAADRLTSPPACRHRVRGFEPADRFLR
ncbi:hypothetical protein ACWD6I_00375 [Streptomyces sp. NPDC002454]